MNVFNQIDNIKFSFNGVPYFRNYVSKVIGNKVEVFNNYERKDIMVPLAHYSEFRVNGASYGSAAALQVALMDVTYSRSNMGGSVFNQNNKARVITLGFSNDLSATSVKNKMNLRSTTITETDSPVFLNLFSPPVTIPVEGGFEQALLPSKIYTYVFKPGKGTYGTSGIPVTTSHLYLISILNLTPEDLEQDPDVTIYPLDVAEGESYIDVANESIWDFSDSGTLTDSGIIQYYFSFESDGVLQFAYFNYLPGTYGDSAIPFTEDMFLITTDDAVPPQILYTSQLINNGNGLSPFATESQLNGLDIVVNQAAAELYLKNDTGETLATVSLGFLNNEGTTFFYNSSTGNLELKNDAGEVLSVIPVSAFVSNLIQSVNFNVASPQILEFKDASGNVVDSVTFTIGNIQGLQSALNAKANDSDVVKLTGNQTIAGVKAFSDRLDALGGVSTGGRQLRSNSMTVLNGANRWVKLFITTSDNNLCERIDCVMTSSNSVNALTVEIKGGYYDSTVSFSRPYIEVTSQTYNERLMEVMVLKETGKFAVYFKIRALDEDISFFWNLDSLDYTGLQIINNTSIPSDTTGSFVLPASYVKANNYGLTLTNAGILKAQNAPVANEDVARKLELDTKQPNLVSGTNIKTVGGVSLLGSGNITQVQNSLTSSSTIAPSADAVNTALGGKANTNGSNASGTWPISISGNASSATNANNSAQFGGIAFDVDPITDPISSAIVIESTSGHAKLADQEQMQTFVGLPSFYQGRYFVDESITGSGTLPNLYTLFPDATTGDWVWCKNGNGGSGVMALKNPQGSWTIVVCNGTV